MSITSPAELVKDLDVEFFKRYRSLPDANLAPIEYVEPDLSSPAQSKSNTAVWTGSWDKADAGVDPSKTLDKISSKVVTLGDFIDTDAV